MSGRNGRAWRRRRGKLEPQRTRRTTAEDAEKTTLRMTAQWSCEKLLQKLL
jgi:hypothetical protein